MNRLVRYATSSIGRKQLMGVSGLLLCGFLVGHLAGNMLILVGQEAFNIYAYKLTSNPLIYVMEAGLGALFIFHLGLGITLRVENKMARPESYYIKRPTGRGTTFASSTMIFTGAITMAFLIKHILDFRLSTPGTIVHGGIEMNDLYSVVMTHYQSGINVSYYVIAVIFLGVHVAHGFSSCFQSLGFNHPKYSPSLKKAALTYAAVVVIGFCSIPIWAIIKGA